MVFLNWPKLPWYWPPFRNFGFALVASVAVPTAFRRALRLPRLPQPHPRRLPSIITQALTYALMLLFFLNELGLGGNNGLTDYKTVAGFPLRK